MKYCKCGAKKERKDPYCKKCMRKYHEELTQQKQIPKQNASSEVQIKT